MSHEKQLVLPGDELVLEPRYQTTKAITIHAPASQIWPWLVQIGVGRGGFYSYDALENMAGLNIHSADRIHPEWQAHRVGDNIPISPVTPLKVQVLDPDHALVLHTIMNPFTAESTGPRGPTPRTFFDWTWAFVLDPITPTETRLTIRARGNYKPDVLRFLAPILLRPVHWLMERGMLQGIQRRAENCGG